MPGVEGCLVVRNPSTGGVLVTLARGPGESIWGDCVAECMLNSELWRELLLDCCRGVLVGREA